EVEQLRGGGLVLVGRRARGGAVGGAAARSSGAARGDGAARGGRAVSVGVGRARGRGGFGPGEVVGQGGDGEHGAGGAEVVVPEAGGKAAVQGCGDLGGGALRAELRVLGLVGRLGVHLELGDEVPAGDGEAAESAGAGGELAGFAAHGQRPQLGVLGLLAVLAHPLGGEVGGAVLGGGAGADGGAAPGERQQAIAVDLAEAAAVGRALRVGARDLGEDSAS